MFQISSDHIQSSIDNSDFASSEELLCQASFFSDGFISRHLLDAMPGMVLIINRHRQIVFANRAFFKLSGRFESGNLTGMRLGDVLSCHSARDSESGCGSGESCETCGALAAMISGLAGEESVQECMLMRHGDNTVQHLTLRIWAVPLNFNDKDFIVLAGLDISHERRRLALERTFFHDILNLVGSIRGFAELMEIDNNVDPLEVSRRIQLASQRVIDEIDAQRVLLAVEKGELQVDQHLLASRDVLSEIVDLYEGQEFARKRFLRIDAASVSCNFVSDITLLTRILGNMVKNALEASPIGDSVTLGVDAAASELIFWVHNTAVIPAIYWQRIFQRDFSTKGSGRGLGTYSMRLLSRFLSGDVSFESTHSGGTRFALHIPVAIPQ